MLRIRVRTYWTKVIRMICNRPVESTCCCAEPGASRRECAAKQGNKSPCACACHGRKLEDGTRFRVADGTPLPAVLESGPLYDKVLADEDAAVAYGEEVIAAAMGSGSLRER
jgi:hypothetical protein